MVRSEDWWSLIGNQRLCWIIRCHLNFLRVCNLIEDPGGFSEKDRFEPPSGNLRRDPVVMVLSAKRDYPLLTHIELGRSIIGSLQS